MIKSEKPHHPTIRKTLFVNAEMVFCKTWFFWVKAKRKILVIFFRRWLNPVLVPVYQADSWERAFECMLEYLTVAHEAVASFDCLDERNAEPTQFILNVRQMLRDFLRDSTPLLVAYGQTYYLWLRVTPKHEITKTCNKLEQSWKNASVSEENAKRNLEIIRTRAIDLGVWESSVFEDFHPLFDLMREEGIWKSALDNRYCF